MSFGKKWVAAFLAASTCVVMSGCSILNPISNTTVTVYSNSLSDDRKNWLAEKAKEAGFEIEMLGISGGELYNRLVAEKSNPVASLVFGLNDIFFTNLIKNDVLEPYMPSWADKLDAENPATEYYSPIVKEPIMIVCNTAVMPTEADRPSKYSDLWTDPRFDGRYEFNATLGGATTQVIISSILSQYKDPNGKLGVSQEGWDNIQAYYEHGSRSVEGTDLYARMANGDVDCGQMWLAGKVTREEQYGIKTEPVRPSTGVPMVRQSIALVKNGSNPDRAKEFIDWFGSAEIQGAWSEAFKTAPTNVDAQKLGSQEAIDFTNSFTAQDIDWDFVAENLDAWVEEIQLSYLK